MVTTLCIYFVINTMWNLILFFIYLFFKFYFALFCPSQVCVLYHSSRQCWILNPLSEARNWTRILRNISPVHKPLSRSGNSQECSASSKEADFEGGGLDDSSAPQPQKVRGLGSCLGLSCSGSASQHLTSKDSPRHEKTPIIQSDARGRSGEGT